ncbi:hypothetical protein RB593_002195 [Gaeumannomyces tritici]
MTAATEQVEHDSGPPAEKPFTEAEIASVIDAVREVSSAATPSACTDEDAAADYWDASTMGQLNEASLAAVARLRSYRPPAFPLWDRLPVSRRAAVLILLYADRLGDLRVVITMRSATLRSFSGQAAFPGGKADTIEETPCKASPVGRDRSPPPPPPPPPAPLAMGVLTTQHTHACIDQVARREAWEEIGLPMDDAKIPAPFTIEQLCHLPHSLARTGLVVRPCVAFLHASASASASAAAGGEVPTADESLIPRLDAKEVAAVFSAPFRNFLLAADEEDSPAAARPLPPGRWYEGKWTEYNGHRWRLHYFFVPVDRQRVTRPRPREDGQAALGDEPDGDDAAEARFKVWGMTGRMLVDAARIAYAEEPEFEHNEQFGDEPMIEELASQIVENKL